MFYYCCSLSLARLGNFPPINSELDDDICKRNAGFCLHNEILSGVNFEALPLGINQLRSGTMCSHSVSHPLFGYNEKSAYSKTFSVCVLIEFFLVLDCSTIKPVSIINLSQPPNYQNNLIQKTLICLEFLCKL